MIRLYSSCHRNNCLCLCVHHQSAGELSGYGWSHIHCHGPERKPPTDIHKVSFVICTSTCAARTYLCAILCVFASQRAGFQKSILYMLHLKSTSVCVSVVCRETALENPEQKSYLMPLEPTLQAAWWTSD